MGTLARAIAVAALAHENQTRKIDEEMYEMSERKTTE